MASHRQSLQPSTAQWRIGLFVLVAVIGLVLAAEFGPPAVGCGIKGNIADGTGERIYHLPGQRYYLSTRVNLLAGERWFCSEADAQAAGWRRSRI